MHKLLIRLPMNVYEQLRKEAFDERTSMSSIIAKLVEDKFKKGGKK